MTFRNKGLNYIKFSLALVIIFAFVVVIGYADKFKKSNDTLYVNTLAFAQTDTNDSVSINLQMVSIEVGDNNEGVITYIVQPGDTLGKIASAFGTTVSHIKKVNNISGTIRPNQKLIITDEENGLLYIIPAKINVLVFANKYSLNIEDLMSLNHIADETEMLQEGQEVFLPISLETAYNAGLMERPKEVYKPKQTVTYKPTITKPTNNSTYVNTNSNGTNMYSSSRVLSSRVFNKNINNKFYAGYCTWYVAATTPQIFPYINETTQARPFGGNANQWYDNAKAAGFSVGHTPVPGSIIVYYRGGAGFSSYGHVAKVISVDSAAGTMVVEEMNGSKKYVVQRRTDRIDNSNIKGYIYMPSTPWTP